MSRDRDESPLGSLVCLILLTWVCGMASGEEGVGRALSPLQEEIRRKQVLSRTFDDEWDLMSRNFGMYQQMTAADREKYRSLYLAIESDHDRDELMRLLDRYYDWLEGLTPNERQSIRSAEGIEKKIARIREIRKRENSTAETEAAGLTESFLKEGKRTGAQPGKGPVESTSERAKIAAAAGPILDLIETRMREIGAIDEKESAHLASLTGWDRHRVLILDYLPNRWRRTSERIFDPATRESVSKEFEKLTGRPLGENERIHHLIATGMLTELRDEYRKVAQDPAELKKFMEKVRSSLSARDRETFDAKPDQEKGDFIIRVYTDRIVKSFARSNEFRQSGLKRGRPGMRRDNPEAGPGSGAENRPPESSPSVPPAGGL